jgi:hypothetical protein
MLVLFEIDWGERVFTEATMKRTRLGAGFTVFAVFFGVATLEAFQTRNWLKAIFWLAIGIAFLVADNLHKPQLHD